MSRLVSWPLKVQVGMSELASRVSNLTLPQRLRGGMIENSVNYLRNVYLDYKSVCLDTIQDIRQRPVRASVIGGTLLASGYCVRHNPTEREFRAQLIEYNNNLSSVPPSIRNRRAYEHIHRMYHLEDQQVLRHQSLGFFSVIYRADYPSDSGLYAALCKYLKPSWRQYITERIEDIGFLDRYWWMHTQMTDYDVNPEEWSHQQ